MIHKTKNYVECDKCGDTVTMSEYKENYDWQKVIIGGEYAAHTCPNCTKGLHRAMRESIQPDPNMVTCAKCGKRGRIDGGKRCPDGWQIWKERPGARATVDICRECSEEGYAVLRDWMKE